MRERERDALEGPVNSARLGRYREGLAVTVGPVNYAAIEGRDDTEGPVNSARLGRYRGVC